MKVNNNMEENPYPDIPEFENSEKPKINKVVYVLIGLVLLIVFVSVLFFIPSRESVCGNEICEVDETQENCCIDCGCLTGEICSEEKKLCVKVEEALDRTKIGDILANPAKYQFGLFTVIGEYRGWQGEGTAPPVTYSDWVIKDDTGLIYVTGLLPGFDPVEDIGLILEVSGMVGVKEGEPYIEAKSVKLFNETKIGDILANPAK